MCQRLPDSLTCLKMIGLSKLFYLIYIRMFTKTSSNAVVIQTHWEHLMMTNPHIGRKIDKSLKAGQKHLAFLMNDMMEGCFVNPELFENKEVELEHKLQVAANFLLKHWEDADVKPIILVSTAEQKEFYLKDYEYVATVAEYVGAMENHEELSLRIEFLLKKEETGPSIYPEYLLLPQIDEGLASGKYQKGQFRVRFLVLIELLNDFDLGFP